MLERTRHSMEDPSNDRVSTPKTPNPKTARTATFRRHAARPALAGAGYRPDRRRRRQLIRLRSCQPGRRSCRAGVEGPGRRVYVRRDPLLTLGEPYYQRRLDAAMATGRRVLSDALAVAEQAGVPATGELLEGHPARRVLESARLRDARLVVLGSRRRLLGSSVSRRVIRSADRPVVIAGRTAPGAV